MELTGWEWIGALPGEMSGQREILRGLLRACESEPDYRWLVVACSVGRGAGDRLSDLDLGIGVRDEVFDAAIPRVRELVDGLGDLVESFHHQIPGLAMRHERVFAQYADRCQVDLVVIPAAEDFGPVRDEVVLYDQDGRRGQPFEHRRATPEQVREWAFLGWCALADMGKYLRRGSAWEALGRLHEARERLWQLLAVAHDVPNPQFGITSILDFAPGQVPAEAGATTSDLDLARLLRAGRELAGQLAQAGENLPAEHRAVLPRAMARYVTADLAAISG